MRAAPRPRLPLVLLAAVTAGGLLSAGQTPPAGAKKPSLPEHLWADVTADAIGTTRFWTNKVEIADLNDDDRPDLLFANGGNYSSPGTPEPNQVFFNRGPGFKFLEGTSRVFGATTGFTRVIKARDFNGDGRVDIIVGATFHTQSRLYLGTGPGLFTDVTTTNLPSVPASVGDIEPGDVDGDGDLDLVLVDWGDGDNMTNQGGRTRLWLNDGTGKFTDATDVMMPATKVRFSWDVELVDVDNDYDLDIVISCKRCPGGSLFRNDGHGVFTEDPRGLPPYTNNYDFEAMDLDGDGFLDLVTLNDGDIVNEENANRREHVFRNDGRGRFVDATAAWWPPSENIGADDNMVAFLDYDSDGDADFLIGSLSGPDRLLINDGHGHLTVAPNVFDGEPTPGTLAIALADLDGDGRMDVVQAQGEHETAVQEKVYSGHGLRPDTAPPSVSMVGLTQRLSRSVVRARVHDRKSPSLATDWKSVTVEWALPGGLRVVPMHWYGEYLWSADWPAGVEPTVPYRVCATDAAGLTTCAAPPPR